MLTHPRSTQRVLCRLMQLRSGHVTLLRAEFQLLKLSSQSDLRRRAASLWALPQISSFVLLQYMQLTVRWNVTSLQVCSTTFRSVTNSNRGRRRPSAVVTLFYFIAHVRAPLNFRRIRRQIRAVGAERDVAMDLS